MQSDQPAISYLRAFAEPEDEALRAARARSEEAGVTVLSPEAGALLRWLATLAPVRHAVEIGTGGGYAALWLIGGLDARGSLTTIEANPDNHALAQQTFAEARVAQRVRAIGGPATSVLPRLADTTYELVYLAGPKAEYPEHLDHAKRLLKPGGLLIATDVLAGGRVADPAADDAAVKGVRTFNAAVRDDPQLSAQIFPVGDGLLAAVFAEP